MNKQLQQMRKLNLDLARTTNKLGEIGSENSNKSRLEHTDAKGLLFASAIKAKSDGSRPIVEDVIFATLDWADLKAGKNLVDVQHRRNPGDRQKPYYSTSITNRSTEKIRIDRFGTYIQKGNTLVLHSITGGFFSSQQFQEWYDLGNSQWIEPGQVVTDSNNHSNLGAYWGYFGTTASGKKFVAGAPWNGTSWWKLWN
jgi:hypothetical protein